LKLIKEIKDENPHFDATYEIADMRDSRHTDKENELIKAISSGLEKLETEPCFETFSGSTDASKLKKNNQGAKTKDNTPHKKPQRTQERLDFNCAQCGWCDIGFFDFSDRTLKTKYRA